MREPDVSEIWFCARLAAPGPAAPSVYRVSAGLLAQQERRECDPQAALGAV